MVQRKHEDDFVRIGLPSAIGLPSSYENKLFEEKYLKYLSFLFSPISSPQ